MKNLAFTLILLIPFSIFAQFTMKRIASLPSGLFTASDGYVVCGDANHDGVNEMIWGIHNSTLSYYMQMQIWQYQPINHYQLVYADTGWPVHGQWPLGIKTGNLYPFACGLLDQDSCSDLVGGNEENVHPDTTPKGLTTVQEGSLPSSYPISLVWFNRWGIQFNVISHYITDLDQDGRKEILMNWSGPRIFENTGNNQYALVYSLPYPTPGSWRDYAFGDFDQDGITEIAYPGGGPYYIFIRKNTGNNQYPVACSLSFPPGWNNPHDCWDGRDVDQDGKPEFFIAFDVEPTFSLYMWEATGNNSYERTFIDQNTISGTSRRGSRVSRCGDIDGDGIEEIVWATHKTVYVYKAIGNNQFQQVWQWWQDHGNPGCIVNIYDMNKNGYNEVIVSGGGKTSIFEVEAVRVLRPNDGEVFHPDSQELIRWQTFHPPRCDSLSLFYSIDNGRTYQSIVHSLSSADTSYLWTVPSVNSDSCKIKIIAYGPGWQYDESDGVFSINSTGVEENRPLSALRLSLKVFPNPAKSVIRVRYSIPSPSPKPSPIKGEGLTKVSIRLFDISGRLVKTLIDEYKKPGNYSLMLNSNTLSSGVYFLSLKTDEKRIIERVVIIR